MATEKKEKAVKETAKENVEKKEKAVKEETIKINIPIDPLNPKDKEIIVGINEKYAKVVRGEETEVSMPVYEQLKNAGLV
jgi:hypothetical protein